LCVCLHDTHAHAHTHTRKSNLNRRGHSSRVFDLASGENTFYIQMRENIPYPHKRTHSIYHTRLVLDFAIGEQGADNGAWWASHHLFFFVVRKRQIPTYVCLSVSHRLCLSFTLFPPVYIYTHVHTRAHTAKHEHAHPKS
jgi:hypothetical protein